MTIFLWPKDKYSGRLSVQRIVTIATQAIVKAMLGRPDDPDVRYWADHVVNDLDIRLWQFGADIDGLVQKATIAGIPVFRDGMTVVLGPTQQGGTWLLAENSDSYKFQYKSG